MAGSFGYGNEPSGFVKYGNIFKSLAASQAGSTPRSQILTFPTSHFLFAALHKIDIRIASFTAMPVVSYTLSLQPQIYRCSDMVTDLKQCYSLLGHDAVWFDRHIPTTLNVVTSQEILILKFSSPVVTLCAIKLNIKAFTFSIQTSFCLEFGKTA